MAENLVQITGSVQVRSAYQTWCDNENGSSIAIRFLSSKAGSVLQLGCRIGESQAVIRIIATLGMS